MKKAFILIPLLSIILLSCSKDDIVIDPDNLLIGNWNYSDYKNEIYSFSRSSEFIDNHCYKFSPDGALIERKNSSWCGTPPISYANYSGTWSIINDTLIKVVVGYWGGEMTYKLDIESIDEQSFKTRFVYPTE